MKKSRNNLWGILLILGSFVVPILIGVLGLSQTSYINMISQIIFYVAFFSGIVLLFSRNKKMTDGIINPEIDKDSEKRMAKKSAWFFLGLVILILVLVFLRNLGFFDGDETFFFVFFIAIWVFPATIFCFLKGIYHLFRFIKVNNAQS